MKDPARKKRRSEKKSSANGRHAQEAVAFSSTAVAASTSAAAAAAAAAAPPASRIFAPFRALGYVCNDVPFAMHVHTPSGALAKPTIIVVTAVGRSWLMRDAASMRLLFVGNDAGATITSLAVTGKEVYAAAGNKVIKYIRGKQAGSLEASAEVGKMLLFGDQIIALSTDGTKLFVWSLKSMKLENEITFHPSFSATSLLHPATYLNKVLIGSSTGELQLWNIRSCSLIHTFAAISSSPITSLAQSPAIDVIAVGQADGAIRIHDLRMDENIMQFSQTHGVTDLTFRMDGPAILASSSTDGSISVWDLAKKRVAHTQRGAHDTSVAGMQWVQGQPLLITSGADNYVKQWLFESPDALPRLLKFRGGHFAPPSLIRYHGEDGKQILTAGRDRSLRYTSVVRDSRSFELSQGSVVKRAHQLGVDQSELKLPQIAAMACNSARSKDWDDVLTAHAGDGVGRTWRVKDKRVGEHGLEVEEGIVQAVCISACGNFGLAGSSTGEIRMFNMQSGKERRRFALSGEIMGDSKPKNVAEKQKKKKGALPPVKTPITGLEADGLNTTLVASTIDGNLYFFNFHNTALLHTLTLPSPITSITLNRASNLLLCICDDLTLRLVDIEARRIVREFRGFRGRILDACFSPDGRWVLATSLDGCVRTFDIPTGRLVDVFRTESVATSLSFSPTGDFLATAHVDSLAVHLWANRAQFLDLPLRHIPEDCEIPSVALPSVQGDDSGLPEGVVEPIGEPEFTGVYTTPEQLSEELVTLSLIPRSRWQTLLNLDTIKQRNKPKEPPKAPEAAPFFIPTVSGLETRFDLSAADEAKNAEDASRRLDLSSSGGFMESEFTRRLVAENIEGDYSSFFTYLKSLPPSLTDLEIRSLLSLQHLDAFITALTQRLRSKRDYEAVQAYLAVFLRVHGDVLVANTELRDSLQLLKEEQKKEGERVRKLVGYALGTIGFLRSAG